MDNLVLVSKRMYLSPDSPLVIAFQEACINEIKQILSRNSEEVVSGVYYDNILEIISEIIQISKDFNEQMVKMSPKLD